MNEPFWRQGLKFECTACGQCCHARGEYSYVYLSLDDRRRLAAALGMGTSAFTQRHVLRAKQLFYMRFEEGACPFLLDDKCSVYQARPDQCRTWPFWRENLWPPTWEEIAGQCPGIDKGRHHSVEEILDTIEKADKPFRD